VIDVPALEGVGGAVNGVEQEADLDVLTRERREVGRGREPGAAQRQTGAAGAGEDGGGGSEVVVAHLHAGDVETAVALRLEDVVETERRRTGRQGKHRRGDGTGVARSGVEGSGGLASIVEAGHRGVAGLRRPAAGQVPEAGRRAGAEDAVVDRETLLARL